MKAITTHSQKNIEIALLALIVVLGFANMAAGVGLLN